MARSWQNALKADLENIKRGKTENNEDATLVQSALDQINDNTTPQEAGSILAISNLNHFTGLVLSGNYHRQVTKSDE